MAVNREPNTPQEAYKAIIDSFVDLMNYNVRADAVRRPGVYLGWAGERGVKKFVNSLDASQRKVLARMLEHARDGAIHDVAAQLDGWLSGDDICLTFRGKKIPIDTYATMHYDYVCRREGDEWPDSAK